MTQLRLPLLLCALVPFTVTGMTACGGGGVDVASSKDPATGDGDGDGGDGDGDGDGGDGDGDGDGDGGDGDGDGDGGDGDGDGDGGDDDDDAALLPNGSDCTADTECESIHCKAMPLGGGSVCSECGSAQDCVDAATGINCALIQGGEQYFVCSNGDLGESCEADNNCAMETYCAEIVAGAGINACSECATNDHCPDGQLCAMNNDDSDPNAVRYKTCVDAGSLPNDTICDLDDGGDEACAGYCVAIPGLPIDIAVCGDCRPEEEDCEPGQSCEPPSFSPATMSVVGSTCVDGDDDDDATGDDDDATGDDDDATGDDDDATGDDDDATGDTGSTSTAR